jgi:hypothetical protein
MTLAFVGGCEPGAEESGTPALSIVLDSVFSLGAVDDPFTPDMETNFAFTDSYLVAGALPGLVHTFDLNGAFLQEFDRRGQGPSEFRGRPLPLAAGGERAHLLDPSTGRYVTMDVAADSVVATGELAPRIADVASSDDGWVVALRTTEGGGYDVVRVSADGTRRSLGIAGPVEASGSGSPAGPVVVTVVAGAAIISPTNRYQLSVFGLEGSTEATVLAHVPSFFLEQDRGTAAREGPIQRFIARLAPGPSGHVWVVSVIPTGEDGSLEDMFLTWVELIDFRLGEVLAAAAFPGISSMTRDGEWLYRFEAATPLPRVHFSRVNVAPR